MFYSTFSLVNSISKIDLDSFLYSYSDITPNLTRNLFFLTQTTARAFMLPLWSSSNLIHSSYCNHSDHFFFFLATPWGLQDLSSPTRDWTRALGSESTGALTTGPPGNSPHRDLLKLQSGDFPGGPVVKDPPSNAGSIPGQGTKIPHAAGQLSTCATTREPVCHKLQSPCSLEPVHHN